MAICKGACISQEGARQTGGRNLDDLSIDEIIALDSEAAKAYDAIRNSTDDIATISKQTGIPEWKVERIKNHVFNNEHVLRYGTGKFNPDIEISDAWKRLQDGNYTQSDLDLLNHEYYEHRFEEYFGTDYDVAHNRTVETGRTWEP